MTTEICSHVFPCLLKREDGVKQKSSNATPVWIQAKVHEGCTKVRQVVEKEMLYPPVDYIQSLIVWIKLFQNQTFCQI